LAGAYENINVKISSELMAIYTKIRTYQNFPLYGATTTATAV